MRASRSSSALLAMLVLLAGCGGGRSGLIEVTDAWGPPTPPNAQAAALYVTIANGTDIDAQLVSATSERCGTIELHATSIDDERIMRMRLAEPDLLSISAGDSLTMEPGGLHIMCIGPTAPLAAGEQIAVELLLESATTLQVEVPIERR